MRADPARSQSQISSRSVVHRCKRTRFRLRALSLLASHLPAAIRHFVALTEESGGILFLRPFGGDVQKPAQFGVRLCGIVPTFGGDGGEVIHRVARAQVHGFDILIAPRCFGQGQGHGGKRGRRGLIADAGQEQAPLRRVFFQEVEIEIGRASCRARV